MTSGRMQNTTASTMTQMEKDKDMKTRMNRAIFLDRDGTINVEMPNYLYKVEDFRFLPSVIEAMKLLTKTDYKLIVVTSQGGVAKGLYTEKDVHAVNRHMVGELMRHGVKVHGVYYCPHHPKGTVKEYSIICECRKPGSKLFEEAAMEFGIDLKKSWVVGNSWKDTEAGAKLGCRTIFVKTGVNWDFISNNEKSKNLLHKADYATNSLFEAASIIKEDENESSDDSGRC